MEVTVLGASSGVEDRQLGRSSINIEVEDVVILRTQSGVNKGAAEWGPV
jgi:hypothetical protein